MTKKKWILLVLAIFLIAVVTVAAFWDTVVIYIAPKSVLSAALQDAMADLRYRYENSPVSLLADNVQPDGQYAAQMDLETENALLGQLHCDMSIQADTVRNRIAAEGVVSSEKTDLDLQLYLDRDFMAISSEDLLGGNHYGITYDSFEADVRSIPLVSILIGESTLSEWNESVTSIQTVMNRPYQIPEIPEISTDDLQRAMLAAMLLPSRVQKVEMEYLGVYTPCYRIDYSAKGEQVGQVLGYLMDIGDGKDAQLEASFYLYKNQLVLAQLNGKAGGNSIRCALEFMLDATVRTLRYAVKEGNTEQGFCLRQDTRVGNGYRNETWTIYDNFEGTGEKKELSYRWEPVMGELVLNLQPAITLNLFQTNEGLHIQTDQFNLLMDALAGKEPDWDANDMSCNLILKKGSSVEAPVYKNIDQWTAEDLLVLLGSVGSLLGLKIR